MQKETQNLHTFHFIMGATMESDLANLNAFHEVGSMSGLIVKILSYLMPRLEKEHFYGSQRGSHYAFVTNDPDEIRKNTYVYMPEKLYKRLKS